MSRWAPSTAGVIPRKIPPPRNSHRQFAGPPISAAFLARDESFLHQPIDHPGDGGTIKGDQSCKGDLINPGVGADGRKRRVLNGRKVVTCPLNLRQEHSHRNLLEAARQVSGHFIDCLHDHLPREAQVASGGLPKAFPTGTVDATALTGGAAGAASQADYRAAFAKLEKVRDISIIVLPGKALAANGSGNFAIAEALSHCNNVGNRMVIIDPPSGTELTSAAAVGALSLPTSNYSALYYPWLTIPNPFYDPDSNPAAPRTLTMAPSAFAAALWSRTDGRRGVWKAPAGVEAQLIGVAGLEFEVGDGDQDQLNPLGVNCLRKLPSFGAVIWGARTLATNAEPPWRYIPVRRTAIMIEQSIYNGIQWAVFEPNDHRLWSSLRVNVGEFMDGLFRAGAFQGETASDAYFVRCALGDTMTQDDIDRGQVIVIIGFAPLKPAEFVIVRIQQKTQQ